MASFSRSLTAQDVLREIYMDSDSDDGEVFSDNDSDFDESESEKTTADPLDAPSTSNGRTGGRDGGSRPNQRTADLNGRGTGTAGSSNEAPLMWTDTDDRPNIPAFTANSGVRVPIPQGATALEYFTLFADDHFFDLLVTETNRYAEQAREAGVSNYFLQDWKPVNRRDITVFLALLMLSGIVVKPQQRLYWSKRLCLYMPVFSMSMPRHRFEGIQTFLHLCNNALQPDRHAPNVDKLFKIRPLVDHIEAKSAELYYPGKNLAVDESMMPWHGRVQFRQFIPSKPYKYGIKMYCLCDAENGYVCTMKIYTGKEGPVPEKDHGSNVVRRLSNSFQGKGHCIYMDNYFSSIPLYNELQASGTSACGTIRSTRKDIPYDLRSRKLKKSESDFCRNGDLMVMKYNDRKELYLLSTAHTADRVDTGKRNRKTQEPIIKPSVVMDYNKYMKGVDQFDQNLMYYSFNKKTMKWWKRAATHLFNFMKVQAYILQKINEPRPKTQLDFTLDLIDEMLARKEAAPTPEAPLGDGQRVIGKDWHYLTPIPPTEKKEKPTRNCKVCTIPSGEKGSGSKRYIHRSESRYECLECGGIPLCVHPCHKLYHTVVDYRKAIIRHLDL